MGDIVATLDNPLYVKGSHKDKTNIIMYDKPAAPAHKINHRNIVEGYINGFGSKVGIYSNHATVIEALKALFTGEDKQRQRDELERRKKLLREVVGAEIDSAKGLKKPKEPWYFTKFVKISEDDDDATKAEKYYHNSLVISKKPYFFRYLYPELNKKYKQYENWQNEKAKASHGIKLKKLLAKPDKTESEKIFVKRYNKFSPIINTNCTMNILCRDIEAIDFDIQWGKTDVSMLPYYDLDSFSFDVSKLKQMRAMYQRWSNKKAISYIDAIYSNEDDADYRECRFGILDAVRLELQREYAGMGLTPKEGLTYIKALSQSYSKFNWGFAWDLIEDGILECLDDQDALIPVECEDGEEYFGHKYVLRNVRKEEKKNFVNEETEELRFDLVGDTVGVDNFDDFTLDGFDFDLDFDEDLLKGLDLGEDYEN